MKRNELINLLSRYRASFRLLGPQGQAGFRVAAIPALSLFELMTPQHELWSSSPDESELTDNSRLGDHLNVTRRALGLTP